MTPEQRAAIVVEARSWLRTPYHDHGRVKGAGADCALFPLDVYSAVLKPAWPEPPRYVQQWHLHRGEEVYLDFVRSLPGIVEIAEAEAGPGDFALFKVGRLYSHGAILIAWPQLIHAVNSAGVILDDAASNPWLNRAKRFFFTF